MSKRTGYTKDDFKLYQDYIKETARRELSNSQISDCGAILASLVGLVLVCVFDVKWAGVMFLGALICVVVSFGTSAKALNRAVAQIWKYYFENDDQYERQKDWFNILTIDLGYAAWICVLSAYLILIFRQL